MAGIEYPQRYRRVPHSAREFAAFHAECSGLLDRATELDAAQRVLAQQLGEVRTKLAEMRVVMWPRVDPKNIVQGYRVTRRGGPPPIPPVAGCARGLWVRQLRSATLAILARHGRPMTLTEIHRQLHLSGYSISSRHPVKRLADALGYETILGRAKRVERGVYAVGELNPGTRRRLAKVSLQPAYDVRHQLPRGGRVRRDPDTGGFEGLHLRLR